MNTNIRATSKRSNKLLTLFLNLFSGIYSYSRLVLEVFIRRNMGRRYFSMAAVITLAVILAILPTVFQKIVEYKMSFMEGYVLQARLDAYKARYVLWYPFIGAFLVMAFIRSREVAKSSALGLTKPSTYSGDSLIVTLLVKLNIKATPRKIETFYEPAFFFIIGFILNLFGQSLGTLLMFSAIFYSLSYIRAYKAGDNYILDKIDAIYGGDDIHGGLFGKPQTPPNGQQKFYSEKPKITKPLDDGTTQFPPNNDEPMIAN